MVLTSSSFFYFPIVLEMVSGSYVWVMLSLNVCSNICWRRPLTFIAKIAGLLTDLNMDSGVQYNWALSIFFFGYLLLEIPSNLLLAHTRPSIYIPSIMMCWAVISALTGAVQNFGGLLAVRFFLGIVEAGFFPGCLFLLSRYVRCWIASWRAWCVCGADSFDLIQVGTRSTSLPSACLSCTVEVSFLEPLVVWW